MCYIPSVRLLRMEGKTIKGLSYRGLQCSDVSNHRCYCLIFYAKQQFGRNEDSYSETDAPNSTKICFFLYLNYNTLVKSNSPWLDIPHFLNLKVHKKTCRALGSNQRASFLPRAHFWQVAVKLVPPPYFQRGRCRTCLFVSEAQKHPPPRVCRCFGWPGPACYLRCGQCRGSSVQRWSCWKPSAFSTAAGRLCTECTWRWVLQRSQRPPQ